MLRKILISLTAAAILGAGMLAMTTSAEAKHLHRRHHHHIGIGFGFFPPSFGFPPGYDYGYPDYGYPYYYDDCRYRRVAIKKWNRAHTRRIVVHRKRWVCY